MPNTSALADHFTVCFSTRPQMARSRSRRHSRWYDRVAAVLQYGARRPENIGKCRTFRVSNREPVRMAVAAMARSALSME